MQHIKFTIREFRREAKISRFGSEIVFTLHCIFKLLKLRAKPQQVLLPRTKSAGATAHAQAKSSGPAIEQLSNREEYKLELEKVPMSFCETLQNKQGHTNVLLRIALL